MRFPWSKKIAVEPISIGKAMDLAIEVDKLKKIISQISNDLAEITEMYTRIALDSDELKEEFKKTKSIEKFDLTDVQKHIKLLHVICRALYNSKMTHVTTPMSNKESDVLNQIYKAKSYENAKLIDL